MNVVSEGTHPGAVRLRAAWEVAKLGLEAGTCLLQTLCLSSQSLAPQPLGSAGGVWLSPRSLLGEASLTTYIVVWAAAGASPSLAFLLGNEKAEPSRNKTAPSPPIPAGPGLSSCGPCGSRRGFLQAPGPCQPYTILGAGCCWLCHQSAGVGSWLLVVLMVWHAGDRSWEA